MSTSTSNLPQELQIDAMHGWRYAVLRMTANRGPRLFSLNGLPLAAEADAKCNMALPPRAGIAGIRRPHPKHQVPEITCTCGFYAMKSREALEDAYFQWPGYALLEVELSGKIIEGTNGYRAAHQTIVCAWLPSTCEIFPEKCDAPATYVHFRDPTLNEPRWLSYEALCEKHTHGGPTPKMTLAELINHTGIEFRWDSCVQPVRPYGRCRLGAATYPLRRLSLSAF